MSSITPSFLERIRQEHHQAPHGAKGIVLDKWAKLLKCNPKKLYQEIGPNTKRKRRSGVPSIKNIEEYTKIVFQIKKRPPKSMGREISTDQAVLRAIQSGLIPEGISVSTFNRVGRQLELNKKSRRIQRFQADRPNEMHHIDASTSLVFYVKKRLPDGDIILKLNRRPSLNYKNKPNPVGLRPWVYGITDDYSGYSIARYVAASGESMPDNLDFLGWAWGKNDDKPFFGLPEKLKSDKGPLMRGKDAEELFDRLGIEEDPSVPYAKEAHGKIERPWRTHWQSFELQFYSLPDWQNYEIKMSELNRQFLNYFNNSYNQRPHRYEKDITREQAWMKISFYGGAVAMPEDAINTTVHRVKRKVATDGCFQLDSVIYEVKGLHDAWVYVIIGVFEDKMIVQDIATGIRYDVVDFKPNPIGTFTAHKDTPHQTAQKAAEQLTLTGGSLFEESKENKKVIHIPTKIKEERVVEDIFDNTKYRSIDEAMKDFFSQTGSFIEAGSESRADIEQIFIDNGLDKATVKEIASNYLRRCSNV